MVGLQDAAQQHLVRCMHVQCARHAQQYSSAAQSNPRVALQPASEQAQLGSPPRKASATRCLLMPKRLATVARPRLRVPHTCGLG